LPEQPPCPSSQFVRLNDMAERTRRQFWFLVLAIFALIAWIFFLLSVAFDVIS
jgi:hypothetical protein